MKFSKQWLVAASITAMVAANGLAFAATGAEQTAAANTNQAFVTKGEHKGGKLIFKQDNAKLLALLKIDDATLRSELKAGKTLAAVAEEHGVSQQQLHSFMVAQMTQRLDEGVTAGKITADRADKIKAGMDVRVAKMINSQGPHKFAHKRHGRAPFADGKLLSLLNIDKDTLITEMKAGKTMAAIAGERGVSQQQLENFLVTEMTRKIDERVQAGKMTADQADKIKAGMAERVAKIITATGPVRMHGERK